MSERALTRVVVGSSVGYLVVLAWAIANLSYDLWGAFVTAPVLLLVGFAVIGRTFRDDVVLMRVLCGGLVLKLAGGIARYWVSFDAYGGATDAARYHTYGARVATRVWTGEITPFEAMPYGTGTHFFERFTGFVYMFTGSSRLAGFVVFAWIAYWGVIWFVKAAMVAVEGLSAARYAALMVLAPSLVFWPSSIGKEAYMLAALGLGTYGIARGLARRGFVVPGVLSIVGLGAAAFVRPHMSGVWIAGLIPALFVALVRGRGRRGRSRTRLGDFVAVVVFLAVAVVALGVIARTTVDYLNPSTDEVSATSVSDILAETTRRTSESGSTFVPPNVNSPTSWPYASLRTLLRPLPIEAVGLGQLLAAAELMLLVVLCAVNWRGLLDLPKRIVTTPYATFAMTTLFLGGLAFASFGNLGVLTRQKSLIFPFMLLLPCLGASRAAASTAVHQGNEGNTMSPSSKYQLVSRAIPT
jgi:hypothetical protein